MNAYIAAVFGFLLLLSKALAVEVSSRDEVIGQLSAEGDWSTKASEGYWEVNQQRLEATQSVAPELVVKEVHLLRALKPKGKLLRLLEEHPEASGLVLLAFERERLASAIVDAPEADRGMLVASYLFCTDAKEVDEWTAAVQRHPRLIAELQRQCAALPFHGLFAYLSTMRLPEARDLYGKWLDEVLAPAVISQSDDALSSRLDFAAGAGAGLRLRLDGDPDFRKDFAQLIWPRFRDCIIRLSREQGGNADIFYLCGGEPLIWDFFRRADAVTLFQNAGMDAVTMLCGDHALHSDVQKTVAALWAKGVLDLPQRIQHYQDNTSVRSLVMRHGESDWPLLNAVCLRLDQKNADWPQEASYLAKLSESALRKEIHPVEPSIIPGAALVSMVGKFLDGRRTNSADWLGAGFDVVDLVTLGAAIEVTGSAKVAALARKAVQQTLKTGARESLEKLTGRTLKQLARESADGEWTQALAKQALEKLPKDIRQALVKGLTVDITDPVKAGFNISRRLGFGREPFKKLTGMEARVFMRQDGRAFINLTHLLTQPSPAARFLTRTAENSALQSEPVEQAAHSAAPALRQWKEDVAAWWSGHATGQF